MVSLLPATFPLYRVYVNLNQINLSQIVMKKSGYILLILILGLFTNTVLAQDENDEELVQFSGMVLDGSTQELFPVPYTNILVKNKGRGTYSDFQGFFSIVVEKGDTIVFSAVGYKNVEFEIPTDLDDNRYSLVQLMTQDAINLPETVVFPWPSREHFKLEFLAMDVTPELQERAARNLANETLARMRNEVAKDGRENANYYMRQQARDYYHIGQQPPMNIFNPVAWKKFFDSWKRGDFKNKKE
ncbi:hypothetical protein CRP01_39345 [Flavilitoribacter nigricans DSM 23189 = NBRC 102662]|uniref:Carboxypeptidase-like regulatory domain-containing protein n=2 Tax=Flavilitoribacter TaxID=2762562 RepID=A0A2D0MXM5_FLAN2|nr:hypothetical protein CRP01_39345 [Flavilitoribacter nigricans DSM 23189 = NBRC 102662]